MVLNPRRMVRRRSGPPVADLGTLVGVGLVPAPRVPSAAAPRPPARPVPDAGVAARRGMLLDALAAAGVPVSGRDEAAVAALAGQLDTATVGAVVGWVRRARPPNVVEGTGT